MNVQGRANTCKDLGFVGWVHIHLFKLDLLMVILDNQCNCDCTQNMNFLLKTPLVLAFIPARKALKDV